MPYANIVYAKLEKRLLNDPRFYMMSEYAQLNYLRLIMFACETYNKITKSPNALKKAFKTDQTEEEIISTIKEIKANFHKFKEGKEIYYFEGFSEKTNWVSPKELRRKSKGTPKRVTEEEEEQEKEKKKNKNIDKLKHLDFVFLLKEEHDKLVTKFGKEGTDKWIDILNNGIASKGYKYQSHYHAILNWARKEGDNGLQPKNPLAEYEVKK